MKDVVIVSAVRTAIGDMGGGLKPVSASELAQAVMKEAITRANVKKEEIEKTVFGNCMAPLEQNIARNAAYFSGIPETVPSFTVNATCGSAMQAMISSIQAIRDGEADIVLAGGVESMSNAPYVMTEARWGQRLRHLSAYDLVWKVMQEYPIGIGMGLTAEKLAEEYGISREDQDEYSLLSQSRAISASHEGKFKDEIVPLDIKIKNRTAVFDTDEHPREGLSMEKLAKLPAAFKKDGTVTAGNSSGINDAAASVLLMSSDRAKKMGIKPLARIVSYAICGVNPDYMGLGPVPSTRKALDRAGIKLDDIDLIELNEAFAAQYLACERELGLNREITNVNGSGISLGHPVGATGCRLVVTLLYEMARRNNSLGLATLCCGGGLGYALIIERIE